MSASPAPNPTRAQLRLVVLGQWVRAGLALARRAQARRGLVGGAVALWQVFQAVRLAIQLAQRLSELQGVLSRAAPETASGETAAPMDEQPPTAAFLRHALIEIIGLVRDTLNLAPDQSGRLRADQTARAPAKPKAPRVLSRPIPPLERPPDRRRTPDPGRARRRRPGSALARNAAPTPFAMPAAGRFRLSAV